AVDTAYFLKKVSEADGKLYQLSLESFKSRLAPGRNLDLEFRAGHGFVPCNIPAQDRLVPKDILLEIITQNPDITGTRIEQLARDRGVANGKIDALLKDQANSPNGLWQRYRGNGNTYHYRVREAAEDAA